MKTRVIIFNALNVWAWLTLISIIWVSLPSGDTNVSFNRFNELWFEFIFFHLALGFIFAYITFELIKQYRIIKNKKIVIYENKKKKNINEREEKSNSNSLLERISLIYEKHGLWLNPPLKPSKINDFRFHTHSLKLDKKQKIVEISCDVDCIQDEHDYLIKELKDVENLRKFIIK